jgi:hypothetical protein
MLMLVKVAEVRYVSFIFMVWCVLFAKQDAVHNETVSETVSFSVPLR